MPLEGSSAVVHSDIILSCYCDDYVNGPADRARASEEAFAMLLDLLGWGMTRMDPSPTPCPIRFFSSGS